MQDIEYFPGDYRVGESEILEDTESRMKALLDPHFFFNIICIIPNIFMTAYIVKIGVLIYKYQVLKIEKQGRLKLLARYGKFSLVSVSLSPDF